MEHHLDQTVESPSTPLHGVTWRGRLETASPARVRGTRDVPPWGRPTLATRLLALTRPLSTNALHRAIYSLHRRRRYEPCIWHPGAADVDAADGTDALLTTHACQRGCRDIAAATCCSPREGAQRRRRPPRAARLRCSRRGCHHMASSHRSTQAHANAIIASHHAIAHYGATHVQAQAAGASAGGPPRRLTNGG